MQNRFGQLFGSRQRRPQDEELAQGPQQQAMQSPLMPVTPQVHPTGAMGPDHGVAGSRFVNYGRMFGLNQEKATKMAGGLSTGVDTAGTGAQNAIEAAKQRFKQGMQAGSLGPFQAPALGGAPAQKIQSPGLASPSTKNTMQAPGTPAPAAPPGAITPEEGQRYSQNNTVPQPVSPAPAGMPPAPMGPPIPSSPPGTRDEIAALAAGGYTGPNDLAGALGQSGYNDLTEQARKAQAGALGLTTDEGVQSALGYTGSSGSSRMDAGLTQGAGRGDFQRLADRYGGLLGQVKAANTDAAGQAKKAAADSAATAEQYKHWLDDYDAAHQPQGPAAEAPKAPGKKVLPNFLQRNDPSAYIDGKPGDPDYMQKLNKETEGFVNFQKAQAKDAGDDLRSAVRFMSPVDHIWQSVTGGKKSPFDAEGSAFNASVHGQTPNASGGIGEHIPWSPDDYVVFRQMDDSQWKELRALGADGQRAWINNKRKELAPDWEKQQYAAGQHKDFF